MRAQASQPQMFSLDADDDAEEDSMDEPSPSGQWNTVPLLDLGGGDGDQADAAAAASLTEEEQQQYEEIEAKFQKFKSRQSEVERNVADLIARLNTRIHVPSSVASSDCGDLQSLASSEWDTESLGPTEDGLSIFGSRMGSRAGTPPGTSPVNSPRGEQRELLLQRTAAAGAVALAGKLQGRQSGGTGHTGGERGDLGAGPRAVSFAAGQPSSAAAASSSSVPSPSAPTAASEAVAPEVSGSPVSPVTPRLTRELLEQAGAVPRQPPLPETPAASSQGQEQLWQLSPDTLPPTPTAAALPGDADGGHSVPLSDASGSGALRLPQFGTHAVDELDGAGAATVGYSAEQAAAAEDEEVEKWCGWTVIATTEGRLFFHHEAGQVSQWQQPEVLCDILGQWEEVVDDTQPDQPRFWRNELLRISLWKDPRQTTNIFQAALDGNLFFMQLYAEVEGHLDVVDPRGRSALHYACAGGTTQSVVFLVQRGAEVDRQDESGATPLVFACRYGYASVVKVLLDAHANLATTCDGGNGALHEAAAMGQLDCLHLLLLCGADPLATNDEGLLAADLAASRRHYSCLTLLRRHSHGHGAQSAAGAPPVGAPTTSAASSPPRHSAAAAAAAAPVARPGPGGSPRLDGSPVAAGVGPGRPGAAGPPPAAWSGGYPVSGQPLAADPMLDGRRQRQVRFIGSGAGGAASGERYNDESSEEEEETDSYSPARGGGHLDDADDAGATSESSDGQGQQFGARVSRQRSSPSRRRERSPVALGLLGRLGGSLTAARRWAFPVQAELGAPNAYQFNQQTQRWELTEANSAGV